MSRSDEDHLRLTPEATRPSLLSRVRDHTDQAAWAEFETRYRDLIQRYCRKSGLTPTDAEDVGQMVMIRLLHVLPLFRYNPVLGRFHDYLYRVIRSAIADFRSCPESRRRTVLDDETIQRLLNEGDRQPDSTWEQEWLDHHLRLALDTVRTVVDPRSVAVFERLLAGAGIELVAAEFGMTAEAVHKVKQRMRNRVQERIAEQLRDEDVEN